MSTFERIEPISVLPEDQKPPDWINHVRDLVAEASGDQRAGRMPVDAAPEQKQKPVIVPEFKGALYLIGGGADATFDSLFRGLPKTAKVVCVGLASELPDAAEREANDMVAAGVPKENITIVYKRGDKPPTDKFACSEDIPADTKVVYFGGGDQERLRNQFDAKQLDAVRKLLLSGATVAGNSAGTAVMSAEMITGGRSDTLTHSAGFGLVSWAVMDTHVAERQRETRDVTALYDVGKGSRPVVGMDPDTAVRFYWEQGKLIGKVSGKGAAHIFMPTNAAPLETSRRLMPKVLETDDGTHRESVVWELRDGDTFVVPNVRSDSKQLPQYG